MIASPGKWVTHLWFWYILIRPAHWPECWGEMEYQPRVPQRVLHPIGRWFLWKRHQPRIYLDVCDASWVSLWHCWLTGVVGDLSLFGKCFGLISWKIVLSYYINFWPVLPIVFSVESSIIVIITGVSDHNVAGEKHRTGSVRASPRGKQRRSTLG